MDQGQKLDRFWTPWRMEYILGNDKTKGCIFCNKPKEQNDRENLIVFRGDKTFIIMNRYPYNNGHLMITPYAHVGDFSGLSDEETAEISIGIRRCTDVLRDALNPDGFNVGINIGKAAGAGIDDHLHVHVVPRWSGDTNFMPVLADVKIMPEYLDDTYDRLYRSFDEIIRNR